MNRVMKELISEENRNFKFKIGHSLASSLAGFIAGTIFATIIWGIVVNFLLQR